jgi:hypothetical protein
MRMKLKVYTPHPEGMFPATIIRFEEDELQHGPVFKVGFETTEGEVGTVFSQNYSEKSKFGVFVEKVLGKRPEDLDSDALIGKKVQILVEHVTKEGRVYDSIPKFMAMGQKPDPFDSE